MKGIYFSHRQLPTFYNLTRMELGVNHTCGWRLLPDLLESSPNLEELVFDEVSRDVMNSYNMEVSFLKIFN